MPTRDEYIAAGTRQNTVKSYASAVRHFEAEWGGFLPATTDTIARYLSDYGGKLSFNTLCQRLAALGAWHRAQGFPDPTRAPMLRTLLKGIREKHPARAKAKQAKPLQLEHLANLVAWLEARMEVARTEGDDAARLRLTRDRALVLLGFWRAFRSDELCRLRVEDIERKPGGGLLLYLHRTKTTDGFQGQEFFVPALAHLCPVQAYEDWIALAGLTEGPVFRQITRWGELGDNPLSRDSIVPILRRCFGDAGLPAPDQYSGHSLRRGFATWAHADGWDSHSLMTYVGWRHSGTAMRYIEDFNPFAERAHATKPSSLPAPTTNLLEVLPPAEPSRERESRPGEVRKRLEISVARECAQDLDDLLYQLVADLHQAAADRQCFVDIRVDGSDGQADPGMTQ